MRIPPSSQRVRCRGGEEGLHRGVEGRVLWRVQSVAPTNEGGLLGSNSYGANLDGLTGSAHPPREQERCECFPRMDVGPMGEEASRDVLELLRPPRVLQTSLQQEVGG